MKKLLFFSAALFCFASAQAVSEQEQIIAELKNAPPYRRKAEKTSSFTQAQLKYGLGTVNYYPAWTDRPLFVDPALAPKGYQWKRGELIQRADLKRRLGIMRDYSMSGMSFFYFNIPRENDRIFQGFQDVPGLKALALISNYGMEKVERAIAETIANPAVYRIRNKPVVVINFDPGEELYRRWKDKCYMITAVHSSILITRRYNDGKMTREDVESLKNLVRKRLHTADGILWYSPNSTTEKGYRRLAVEFQRDVLYPLTRSVFAEKGFEEKLMAGRVTIGHENAYGYGYYEASDGMASMLTMFQSALDNNVEFINQNEWDEQNENTSSRPTVYNSLAYMRLWRYFGSRFNNTANEPLAHDDLSVPPLIFSIRKKVTLGERIQLQLLHIPTAKWEKDYTVKVILKDTDGKVVYTSPTYRFSHGELKLERIYLAGEKFASSRALIPEISVDTGKIRHFTGLHPLELKVLHNNDFKFVHHPLRDQMQSDVQWDIAAGEEEGFFKTSADISASAPLAVAELLEGSECLYAHGATPPEGRENDSQYAIQIQPWGIKHGYRKGVVRLKNAPPATGFISYSLWSHSRKMLNGNEWEITEFNAFPPYMVMMIDKKGSENAVIEVDYPGIVKKEIPLKELLAKRTYTVGGKDGFSLGFIRQMRQITHPELLKRKKAHFTCQFAPVNEDSMILLQAVAVDGRIWRSTPRFLKKIDREKVKRIRVWSETEDKSVTVDVPAELVPDLHVSVDTSYGSIVPTGSNRASWGIRGGFTEQFLEHCGMDGTYGNLLACHLNWPPQYCKYWQGENDFVPQLVDGAWKFNGAGAHLQFTQEFLPRRADYTLEFEIKPDDLEKKQLIFDSTPYFWGDSYLWNLTLLPGGEMRMNINGEPLINSGLKLKKDVWSRVRIHNFRDSGVLFEVDGEKNFIPVKFKPMINICTFVIGGRFSHDYKGKYRNFYFKGEMRNISVKYGLPPEYEYLKSGRTNELIPPPKNPDLTKEQWLGGCRVGQGSEQGALRLFSGRDVYSSTMLRINPSAKFRLSGKFRSNALKSRFYFGAAMYDGYNRMIRSDNVNVVPQSDTILVKEAKKGDREIWVENGEKWQRGNVYIAFNSAADYSDLPNFNTEYHTVTGAVKQGNMWKISLAGELPKSYPAAVGVRLHKPGAFALFAASYAKAPAAWQEFSLVINGTAASGAVRNAWWKGTCAVKFVIMFDKRDEKMPEFEFRDLLLEEIK